VTSSSVDPGASNAADAHCQGRRNAASLELPPGGVLDRATLTGSCLTGPAEGEYRHQSCALGVIGGAWTQRRGLTLDRGDHIRAPQVRSGADPRMRALDADAEWRWRACAS